MSSDTSLAETPAGESPFELDHFLPYRFNVLAECMSRSLARIYQEQFGISVPEWRVLATLGRESPLSAGEVGSRAHMEKARVSRTLARMLDAGLINRQVDARDNRVAVLALTRRGQDMFRRIAPLARAWEAEMLQVLDAGEVERLHELLDRLLARLRGMRDGGDDGADAG